MVLWEGWSTKQMDYTNALDQAKMKETVFIEHPLQTKLWKGSNSTATEIIVWTQAGTTNIP
jgi:hypothetical protein